MRDRKDVEKKKSIFFLVGRILLSKGGIVHVEPVGGRRECLALGNNSLGCLGGDGVQGDAVQRAPEPWVDLVRRRG